MEEEDWEATAAAHSEVSAEEAARAGQGTVETEAVGTAASWAAGSADPETAAAASVGVDGTAAAPAAAAGWAAEVDPAAHRDWATRVAAATGVAAAESRVDAEVRGALAARSVRGSRAPCNQSSLSLLRRSNTPSPGRRRRRRHRARGLRSETCPRGARTFCNRRHRGACCPVAGAVEKAGAATATVAMATAEVGAAAVGAAAVATMAAAGSEAACGRCKRSCETAAGCSEEETTVEAKADGAAAMEEVATVAARAEVALASPLRWEAEKA